MNNQTVTYNEGGLETHGLNVFPSVSGLEDATTSGLSVITFGFLWDERDIYTPCETPIALTYTECEC